MSTLTTPAKTKESFEALNTLIINRTEEFNRDIERFSYFINNAIIRELHALTTGESSIKKLSLSEFEDLTHNIEIMKDIIELTTQKQILDEDGFYYPKE